MHKIIIALLLLIPFYVGTGNAIAAPDDASEILQQISDEFDIDLIAIDNDEDIDDDEDMDEDDGDDSNGEFIPIKEILSHNYKQTPCASNALSVKLSDVLNDIDPGIPDEDMSVYINTIFTDAQTLQAILECPEIKDADKTDIIKFQPIVYKFNNGRIITINYETQPQILQQRMLLTQKRSLPSDGDPSPAIGPNQDGIIWTYTDPAWYGILVTQAGALDNFVGPDKNNTISLRWLYDNIKSVYPNGHSDGGNCTTRSGIGGKSMVINKSMHETSGFEAAGQKDPNNYYIAGDIQLGWIMYAEIAADVILTVVTFGGGAVISGATKAVRATRAVAKLQKTLRALSKTPDVIKYVKLEQKLAKAKKVQKAEQLTKKQMKQMRRQLKQKTREFKKNPTNKQLEQELRTLTQQYSETPMAIEKEMAQLEKKSKDVKKYRKASDAHTEAQKYRRSLRSLKRGAPKRGNIIARAYKALKAANTGTKTLNKAARMGRMGTKTGHTRDWLFHSTMSNIGSLGKLMEGTGIIYGATKFLGDMYDKTEVSTDKYTNGIDFMPYGLLSADELEGYENVTNYGMWLMWMGDSISAADDDAAFLETMDFATKAAQDLEEYQSKNNTHACNVDFYVVRPIIRNPGTDDQELYYLIMNDIPWHVE